MTKKLACGVAGAGVFGGNHARQYASLEPARLAAVFDPDAERASALAKAYGADAFDALEPFLAKVEVVSIASPAAHHAEIARRALKAGRHVYVEKPIATSLEEAEALLELARAGALILAVGHQERIIFEAMGLFAAPEPPLLIEAVRNGTPSPRNLDVSCVLDLMIHDLDLAIALALGPPLAVEAAALDPSRGRPEAVRAEVVFEGGLVGVFEASRIAPARDRRMRIVYPSGALELDFLTRSFNNRTGFPLNADFADTARGRDPLRAALSDFLHLIRHAGEAGEPLRGARQAAQALDLGLAVEQALEGD